VFLSATAARVSNPRDSLAHSHGLSREKDKKCGIAVKRS
jgi:hypothetical protein